MKKMNRSFFVTVVVIIALSATLTGCGKKNPPIAEVTIDETSIPTQGIETQESEIATEVMPTSTDDGNNTVSTSEPVYTASGAYVDENGEVVNSKVFTSYWDYENNSFDLKEYLESTNPYRLFEQDTDNNGAIDQYCVMYGSDDGATWGITIASYTIYLYDVCAAEQYKTSHSYDFHIIDVSGKTPITVNNDGLALTSLNLSAVELAINTAIKAVKNDTPSEALRNELDNANIKFEEKIERY